MGKGGVKKTWARLESDEKSCGDTVLGSSKSKAPETRGGRQIRAEDRQEKGVHTARMDGEQKWSIRTLERIGNAASCLLLPNQLVSKGRPTSACCPGVDGAACSLVHHNAQRTQPQYSDAMA